jgi:hypothetical protein
VDGLDVDAEAVGNLVYAHEPAHVERWLGASRLTHRDHEKQHPHQHGDRPEEDGDVRPHGESVDQRPRELDNRAVAAVTIRSRLSVVRTRNHDRREPTV